MFSKFFFSIKNVLLLDARAKLHCPVQLIDTWKFVQYQKWLKISKIFKLKFGLNFFFVTITVLNFDIQKGIVVANVVKPINHIPIGFKFVDLSSITSDNSNFEHYDLMLELTQNIHNLSFRIKKRNYHIRIDDLLKQNHYFLQIFPNFDFKKHKVYKHCYVNTDQNLNFLISINSTFFFKFMKFSLWFN